jgi:hypothetical protein
MKFALLLFFVNSDNGKAKDEDHASPSLDDQR